MIVLTVLEMDRDRPKTIVEDVEISAFENRENVNPKAATESRDTPSKDTPNR